MNTVLVSVLFLFSTTIFAFSIQNFNQKSICGSSDDRVFSYDQKIGRAQSSLTARGGCSITMIGKSCAITAGHCLEVLKFVEFNPKHPDAEGNGGHATMDEIYEVNQESIVSTYSIIEDWAVFRLNPHAKDGRLAGEVYGTYPVSFKKPHQGETVVITGYGIDRKNPERYCTQQTHSGEIANIGTGRERFTYRVDTEPGNSGSAVILESTGEIIAVHTNGGCSSDELRGANRGTLISNSIKLQKAITSCLKADH